MTSAKKFTFPKLYLADQKLFFLAKDKLILCGDFSDHVNTYYMKLYLLHIYVSFINFNENLVLRIQSEDLDIYESFSEDKSPATLNYKITEYLPLKVFEGFIIPPMTSHFESVFKVLTKKEDISLSYIKFKNMYVVDLMNQEILFDMNSFKVKNVC